MRKDLSWDSQPTALQIVICPFESLSKKKRMGAREVCVSAASRDG